MGHNITNRDQQHGLKQAWHRLTRVKEKIDPNDNYLTSWDVERRTLSFEVDGEDVDSGFDILVGSDDEQLIGKPMSKAYKEISNESFMDLVSDAMNRLPKAKLESVGSVSNRGKVFATISLSDHKDYNIGDRKFQDFLNFGNAHDQSSRLWINNTNICTVCENTFNFNLRSNEGLVGSAVHRGDVELKLADLTVLVDEFLGTQEDFKTKFDKLLQRRIDLEKAQQLYTGFLTRNNPRSVRVPGASTQLNVLVSYLLGVQVTVERTTLMRSLQSLTTTHIVVRVGVVRIKLASIIRLSTG